MLDLILPSVFLMEMKVVGGPTADQECVIVNIDNKFDLDYIIVVARLVGKKMDHCLKSDMRVQSKNI